MAELEYHHFATPENTLALGTEQQNLQTSKQWRQWNIMCLLIRNVAKQ